MRQEENEYERENRQHSSRSGHRQHSSRSGSTAAALMVLLGIICFMGSWFIPKEYISESGQYIIAVFGIVILIIGTILWIIAKLYVKTPANQAFIRTGMGGKKVIIDGGAIVIPMFHELKVISLETMKLIVSRVGKGSLLTNDKLRADITAEFYIKVPKTEEGVINAATSLGDRGMSPDNVKELVEEKLISTLRSVSAKSTLAALHQDRETFASSIFDQVKPELVHNGLELEGVTISNFDQANMSAFDENNVFDAEGARTVAEITSKLKVERNKFEKKAEQEIGQENLATQKILDTQTVEKEESAEERQKNVTILVASKKREAAERAEEERRKTEEATINTDEAIGKRKAEMNETVKTAEVQSEKAVKLASIEKEKAEAVADEERQKTVGSAQIDRKITILEKLKDEAAADESKNQAQAKAEKAKQDLETVTVVETAGREKKKTVIDEEAKAQQQQIQENVKADIQAYSIKTIATADKEAAQNRAEATVREATAKKDAAVLESEGRKAQEMVPVIVEREKVAVRAEEVKVIGQELKFKAEYSQVAVELETALADIHARKDVGVAFGNALGVALGNANMNIYGDGDTAAKIMRQFADGQSQFYKINALSSGTLNGGEDREAAKELVAAYLKGQKEAMAITGAEQNISDAVKQLIREFVKSSSGNPLTGLIMMGKFLLGGLDPTEDQVEKLNNLVKEVNEDVM